jgi:hypothetical protein
MWQRAKPRTLTWLFIFWRFGFGFIYSRRFLALWNLVLSTFDVFGRLLMYYIPSKLASAQKQAVLRGAEDALRSVRSFGETDPRNG